MGVELLSINKVPHVNINSKKFNLSVSFSMYEALEELRSLKTGLEIKFESFAQFSELINQVNKSHKNN